MRTDTQPNIATVARPRSTRGRRSRSWFWPGIGLAVFGLVVGLFFGVTSYQDSQQEIDSFARVAVPGTLTLQVDEPGQQVVYYEGDQGVGLDNLVVSVADPAGSTVSVAPYRGELIYETTDLTLGRAIATFDATRVGAYQLEVRGIGAGAVTVGESFALLALPGVLAGLAIAGLGLVAGFVLWLYSILRR